MEYIPHAEMGRQLYSLTLAPPKYKELLKGKQYFDTKMEPTIAPDRILPKNLWKSVSDSSFQSLTEGPSELFTRGLLDIHTGLLIALFVGSGVAFAMLHLRRGVLVANEEPLLAR